MRLHQGAISTADRRLDLESVSFHETPVLVLEDFWSAEDRRLFRRGMETASWRVLSDIPHVQANFPNSGNWAKADMAEPEGKYFFSRLMLPCIQRYIESFANIVRRQMSFSYYAYAAGDCLLTHDDTDEGAGPPGTKPPTRRIAVVSYFHEEWKTDWGGELMIYGTRASHRSDEPDLEVTHCIPPRPGTLVLFTVPRFHRVCRVDSTARASRRLSIAGWFMTEHA